MSATWHSADPPPEGRTPPAGWLRAGLRLPLLVVLIYGGLLIVLLLRLFERPLCGLHRPVSPYVNQFVCRAALLVLGIRLRISGRPMREKGAVVSNHASWLDILVLNAAQRVYFVSKSEVGRWPGIGWLARATGTVFVNRNGREAKTQQLIFEARLRAGHRLLFFPEGTSSDGLRVLPFKSTLFAAFFTHGLNHILHIQPVSLRYRPPAGGDARFYAWWGDMDLGPHLLRVLAARHGGAVDLAFHAPVRVDDFADRKTLAQYCEATIRAGQTGAA